MKLLLIILAVVLMAVPASLLMLSGGTVLKLDPPVTAIGNVTPVQVRIENAHGVRRITGAIEQDGSRHTVFDVQETPHRVMFWRRHEAPQVKTFQIGKQQAPALHDGKARLIIETVSNDLRGRVDSIESDVQIVTQPPRIAADGAQHYINQGGSELVVFTPSGYVTESGVRVGKYTFRSFPLASQTKQRFSLFAYPWDLPADTVPVAYARNPAGAEATARFWYKVFPKKFRSRDLPIDDAFLEKVVNQIDPGGSGDLLARFLKINGEMRRKNNQTLADLRLKTADRFLWSGPFLPLTNAAVESSFADKRSYIYKGKKVDEQVHLGFDLAVTLHVSVPAANDGRVVWADNLGIYGNCVVVDHGYGLQSIYGHLSEIAVKPGDMVKKSQSLGKSGSTGLAGGDHLHFSMQVDGVQVNPIEWWDEHWIKDRILSKVGAR
ncbi:MAG TPA: M23 family metallopeptidase [Bryobacteraceae bacterium]|nr:M23 family metallopeptidase [Bryobacteraceae bacterium]